MKEGLPDLPDRPCMECGQEYPPIRLDQRYCSSRCGHVFNTRRQNRGLQLYDLMMIYRYDRKGEGPEAMKLMSRFAQMFRDEDKRATRPRSWLTLRELNGQLAKVRSTKV